MSLIPPAHFATVLRADYRVADWNRWPRPRAYSPSLFMPAFRTGVVSRAFDQVAAELLPAPRGVPTMTLIGKLSHDSQAHPGTRVEQRHGTSVWHCPCGYTATFARHLHRHVARAKDSSGGQRCPVTVAAEQALASTARKARLAAMSSEELAAYIARLSA